MKHTREMVDVQGRVWREVVDTKTRTSWNDAEDFIGGLNYGIGRMLSPVWIKPTFSVSTSWVLFGLTIASSDSQMGGWIGIVWLLSLFIKFR